MFDRIDRVMLPVRNVASAARWYVETFACRIVSQDANEALIRLKQDRIDGTGVLIVGGDSRQSGR